jgi:hypothetical protein
VLVGAAAVVVIAAAVIAAVVMKRAVIVVAMTTERQMTAAAADPAINSGVVESRIIRRVAGNSRLMPLVVASGLRLGFPGATSPQ